MSVQTAFEYALDQNYPNPFNPSTAIQFSLEKPGKTVLEIYNTLGQKVATLVNGELSAGAHRYQWNASGLASGVYFYRLQSNEFVATKKMILVK
jgi:flagellar hook assembly protein FlgD